MAVTLVAGSIDRDHCAAASTSRRSEEKLSTTSTATLSNDAKRLEQSPSPNHGWYAVTKLSIILALSQVTDLSKLTFDYILGTTDRGYHWSNAAPTWSVLLMLCCLFSWQLLQRAECCATRPWQKPRPVRPTWSPDIYLERENCTDDYAALFCLNGGVCFRTKIVDTFIISCECQPGWYGHRCEYQDIGDRYLPVQQRLEVASIAGSLTVLIVIVIFASVAFYIYYRRKRTSPFEPSSHTFANGHSDSVQGGRILLDSRALYVGKGKSDQGEKENLAMDSLKPVNDGLTETDTRQTVV